MFSLPIPLLSLNYFASHHNVKNLFLILQPRPQIIYHKQPTFQHKIKSSHLFWALQQSQTAGSFTISHLNLISRMSLPALEGRGWWWWMSKFTLGNQSVLLSLPWERLSADPKTRKWSKTLVYEVSKSNERCILRWKLGRMVGVGGDTALHRGIPMGGWYGKMERGGGGVQRGH